MGERDEITAELKSFIPVVEGLGKTLGRHFEVVLHDLANKESSVIAIENGHITKRQEGSPPTDLLIDLINNKEFDDNMKLNYFTHTDEGKPLKSSTFLIRNNEGEIIGALCMNIDLTSIKVGREFLENLEEVDKSQELDESPEKFPENVESFMDIIIENSLEKVNKPINLLSKEDKLKIVSYLDKNQIFNIKGAVARLANKLKVSRFTIYNYIDEVRAEKN